MDADPYIENQEFLIQIEIEILTYTRVCEKMQSKILGPQSVTLWRRCGEKSPMIFKKFWLARLLADLNEIFSGGSFRYKIPLLKVTAL